MKKLLLTVLPLLAASHSYVQNTDWSTSKNIGIGTLSPANSLQVRGLNILSSPNGGDYNENLRLLPSPVNDYSSIALGAVPGISGTGLGQWTLIRASAQFNYLFSIRWQSTDYLSITPSGNIGLVTNTPTESLTVGANSDAISMARKLILIGSGGQADLLSKNKPTSIL